MSTLEHEPLWLTAAVDQRLALMKSMLPFRALPEGTQIIMTPLAEPAEGATRAELERWERSCDNCKVYCEPGADFFTGVVARKFHEIEISFTFGMCKRCKDAP